MKKILILFFILFSNYSLALEWSTEKITDEWEGTTRTLIFSDYVNPNKPLDFPYQNPTVYMYWDCDVGGFTMRNTASNILDTDIADGYSLIQHDIKIDGDIKPITSYQQWSSEYITLDWYNNLNLQSATELVVRLNHYSDGYRQYTFDLSNFDHINGCY
tara:strand:+ start:316 stop:792 length:477 start_codon:yes stop_codon:yes gene_type:complete